MSKEIHPDEIYNMKEGTFITIRDWKIIEETIMTPSGVEKVEHKRKALCGSLLRIIGSNYPFICVEIVAGEDNFIDHIHHIDVRDVVLITVCDEYVSGMLEGRDRKIAMNVKNSFIDFLSSEAMKKEPDKHKFSMSLGSENRNKKKTTKKKTTKKKIAKKKIAKKKTIRKMKE